MTTRFTINRNFGIGQVMNIENGKVEVYFSEVDETKTLIEKFTKFYDTEMDAYLALNPEMTEEEAQAIFTEIKEEERASREGANIIAQMEENRARKVQEYMAIM